MLRLIVLVLLIFFNLFYCPAFADMQFLHRADVQAFISKMVKKYHFDKDQLNSIFNEVKIRPQILQNFKAPLEKRPWYTYQMLLVSEWRIEHGVEFWNQHEADLKRAEKMYNIPASIIVATIGIESKYGERIGDYRVIDSLTNLAFSNSPRASFFRQELEQFFLLAREEKLNPLKVMGSYAGAIGQPQFMPSSYRNYAINFSGSGKTDLMHDDVDVIGSVANYYKQHGWQINQPVVIPAAIIGDRYRYLTKNNKITQPILVSDLTKYGIVPKFKILPESQKVKIIELQGPYNKEYWLSFENFDVIKRYNASDLYAMAVYQLSNYIYDLRNRLHNG